MWAAASVSIKKHLQKHCNGKHKKSRKFGVVGNEGIKVKVHDKLEGDMSPLPWVLGDGGSPCPCKQSLLATCSLLCPCLFKCIISCSQYIHKPISHHKKLRFSNLKSYNIYIYIYTSMFMIMYDYVYVVWSPFMRLMMTNIREMSFVSMRWQYLPPARKNRMKLLIRLKPTNRKETRDFARAWHTR